MLLLGEIEKMTKEKTNKKLFVLVFLGVALGLIGGITLGMTIQQMIFGAGLIHIAEAFSGEINIDLNETELVEQTKEAFVPIMTLFANNSVMKDFSNCKPVPCDCWGGGCGLYCMQCEVNKSIEKLKR